MWGGSVLTVRKDVMFLREMWDVAIRTPHKHVAILCLKNGTSILKIHRDVTLLREVRNMCIVRVM